MSPSEMLEEGIKTQDWELIKQAKELMKGEQVVVKPHRGRPKKIVDLGPKRNIKKGKIRGKKTKGKAQKTPKFKNDEEYFSYLAKIEYERAKQIGAGQNIKLGENISVKSDNILENESLILNNKGKFVKENDVIKKSRSARRPPVVDVIRNCVKCGKETVVPENMVDMYCYSAGDTNSTKPLFTCGKCGV